MFSRISWLLFVLAASCAAPRLRHQGPAPLPGRLPALPKMGAASPEARKPPPLDVALATYRAAAEAVFANHDELTLSDTAIDALGVACTAKAPDACGLLERVRFIAGRGPEWLSGRDARYTREAIEHRAGGTVVASCAITEAGEVRRCRILRGMPYGMSEEVLSSLESRRVRPKTRDGKPVPLDPYVFTLRFKLPGASLDDRLWEARARVGAFPTDCSAWRHLAETLSEAPGKDDTDSEIVEALQRWRELAPSEPGDVELARRRLARGELRAAISEAQAAMLGPSDVSRAEAARLLFHAELKTGHCAEALAIADDLRSRLAGPEDDDERRAVEALHRELDAGTATCRR